MGQFDRVLEDARQLAKAGKQKEAHQKINHVLLKSPDEKRALWYMATVTQSPREKYEALTRLTQVYPDFQPGWDLYNQLMRDAALRSDLSNEDIPVWAKKVHGMSTRAKRAPWWGWVIAIVMYVVLTGVVFFLLEIYIQTNSPDFRLMDTLRTQLLIVCVPGLLLGFFQTLRVTSDQSKSVGIRLLYCAGVFMLSSIIIVFTLYVMKTLFGFSALNILA